MKSYKLLILGFCFFTVSALFIANIHYFREFFPTREVELSHGAAFGPLVKDYLFVQEVNLKKRYINRIDVFLANIPDKGPSENVFLLLDTNHRIIYTKRISSGEIDGAHYYPVNFKKSIDIGKGNKIFACLYSIDGTMKNYLVLPRKASGKLGKLYVIPIQNNDVIYTLEKKQGMITFEGSMGIKTFESNSRFFTSLQIILYLLALLFTLLIILARKIKPLILKSNPSPEYVFCGISLFFGLIMVFLSPPFQIPDEPQHFYRSYQIAQLNIFKYHDSIPQSLVQLASISDRMKFMAHEKTSKKEILGLSDIKLNPSLKTSMESPQYVVPYLPQALGIMIGRLFRLEPLGLFYLGRIFNLLVSVILLFIAIRITPVLKWLFFSLSILPMILYQMSSLSYDALTISLSFLVIAMNFNFAFNDNKTIRLHDILILFGLAILLAACKPPYYIVVFSFLTVPVKKIGSLKKYLIVVSGLIITVLVVSQAWTPSRIIFSSFHEKTITVPETGPQPAPVAQGPDTKKSADQQPPKQQNRPASTNPPLSSNQPEAQTPQNKPAQQAQPAVSNPFDPPAQKKFILKDPIRFAGIIIDTIKKFIGLYLISFIGLFGWVDTPLPPGIIYPYFILLILIALSNPVPGIKIGFLKKCILFSLFLLGIILVETAMYIYCNPVGCSPITAVQGRYFLAFGPLLFIIFYNHYLNGLTNKSLSHSKKLTEKEKRNQRKKINVKVSVREPLYDKSLPLIVMAYGVFVLIYSLYLILTRFYIVLI